MGHQLKQQQHEQVHVVMLPFPIVGRTNPMLEFAKHLASKQGILVTFATTSTLSNKLTTTHKSSSSLTICTLSDSLRSPSNTDNLNDYTETFATLAPLALSKLIKNITLSSPYPVRCLIYDSSQIWALPFARDLGIFGAPFFPQSCAVSLIFRHVFKGVLCAPPNPDDDDDTGFVSAPGLPPMAIGDFPSFVQQVGRFPMLEKVVLNQFHNFDDADWQFFNSFDVLEDKVVKWMRKQWPRVMSIGPTIPSKNLDTTLDAEASSCIQWLDTQSDASTLYVSFGSLADLSDAQMEELASALNNSNKPFLWVVMSSQENKLPKGFKKHPNGLIVNWCPQLAVLAHRAIGCFFTHCGWNSTLEAIYSGVPLVAMPQWADQPTNAMFVHEVWRVGIRVKPDLEDGGLVKRDEIEACVREVMEGESGQVMRLNAAELKVQAMAAMQKGGSSDRNIDEFVAKLFCG